MGTLWHCSRCGHLRHCQEQCPKRRATETSRNAGFGPAPRAVTPAVARGVTFSPPAALPPGPGSVSAWGDGSPPRSSPQSRGSRVSRGRAAPAWGGSGAAPRGRWPPRGAPPTGPGTAALAWGDGGTVLRGERCCPEGFGSTVLRARQPPAELPLGPGAAVSAWGIGGTVLRGKRCRPEGTAAPRGAPLRAGGGATSAWGERDAALRGSAGPAWAGGGGGDRGRAEGTAPRPAPALPRRAALPRGRGRRAGAVAGGRARARTWRGGSTAAQGREGGREGALVRGGEERAGACARWCVCGGREREGGSERGEERAASAPLAPCEGAAEPGAGTGPRWSEPGRSRPPASLAALRGGCANPGARLRAASSGCRRGAARRRSGERAPAGRRSPPGEGLVLGARLPGAGSGEMAAGRARRLLGSLWIALLLGQPDPAGAAARSGSQSLFTGKEQGESPAAAQGRGCGGCEGAAGGAEGARGCRGLREPPGVCGAVCVCAQRAPSARRRLPAPRLPVPLAGAGRCGRRWWRQQRPLHTSVRGRTALQRLAKISGTWIRPSPPPPPFGSANASGITCASCSGHRRARSPLEDLASLTGTGRDSIPERRGQTTCGERGTLAGNCAAVAQKWAVGQHFGPCSSHTFYHCYL